MPDFKHVLFFSSDAEELYKGDIFRSLALPSGYTIQFRYPKNIVLKRIADRPGAIIGRKAVIIFVSGNDQKKTAEERVLACHPIRECIVRHFYFDENVERTIAILELGRFVDFKIDVNQLADELPPSTFVSEASLNEIMEKSWLDRVKAIEIHFPKTLFYSIVSIRQESVIKSKLSVERRRAYYQLQDESEYSIEVAGYDRSGGTTPLKASCECDRIVFSNSFQAGFRAKCDTQRLPLTTLYLSTRSVPLEIIFHTGDELAKDPNIVSLQFRIERKHAKTLGFACLTIVAALGLGLAQGQLKNSTGVWLSDSEIYLKLGGAILFGSAASLLFRFFNKT